jgi:DNA-binding CsgD family transcriptional regulator
MLGIQNRRENSPDPLNRARMGEFISELSNSRLSLLLTAVLGALTFLGILDLFQDAPKQWLSPHGILESLFILISLVSAVLLWRGWRAANSSLARTRQALEARQSERDAWRGQAQGYLRGLGEAIAGQFREWELTATESETALLLLKGFSHKEIGLLTKKSERTVRQHAIAVYRKSGLSGRAELSAFFLEDLLLPVEDAGSSPRDLPNEKRR